jgi:hypothetical protein
LVQKTKQKKNTHTANNLAKTTMGFLFWGSKNKRSSQRHLNGATNTNTLDGGSVKSKTSNRSAKTTQSKTSNKSHSKQLGVEQPLPKDNKYIQAVKTCMEKMNSFVPEDPALYAKRILDCFASPDSPLIAEDGEKYKATDLSDLCVNICKSFPDFHMKYGDVTFIDKSVQGNGQSVVDKTLSDEETIVAQVELDGLIVSGTHTGAPYTIAPGVLPALPPSGTYVENDEQRMVFFLNKKAKIVKSQLISLGVHTGAIGLYTLAGGDASPLFVGK